jgi:excisionase family DNA binding protein
METTLLRAPEVARRLDLGESTVRQMMRRGELPVVRFGRAVRVPARALEIYIERRIEGIIPSA